MNEAIRNLLDAVAPMLNGLMNMSAAQIIGAIFTLLGVGLLIYVSRLRRNLREQRAAEALAAVNAEKDARIASLEQTVAAQSSALDMVGDRVLALEDYLEMLGVKQQKLAADKKGPAFYAHLRNLADKGMNAAELSRRFGISVSEASLLTAMNKKAV
ncbi:Protein of unknown function (DUF2802) [Spongiibacter sp. IMCC21906]|uniref:DUF2802 domain-containing protein n=1 Tax=Spongiibacter sp. IMCC21906 TaxID=1620392 RepID=UPI00062DD34E|nr:DUF2802 domain-containing protein [Spongiibacter sp. IMCC21906]AKH69400.1 Protein of unknown function (DUF2802) [Spongiibacter sp. IMCC21906]